MSDSVSTSSSSSAFGLDQVYNTCESIEEYRNTIVLCSERCIAFNYSPGVIVLSPSMPV